jgi:hypothetical protein
MMVKRQQQWDFLREGAQSQKVNPASNALCSRIRSGVAACSIAA